MVSSANRIAANTVIMYIRMLFLIVITFYTSRLLLSTLGVEDFGIQSVVGSISSTFLSLKALFSESVQRFLNFEKGKQSIEGQRTIFSISIYIHICLAVFFVLLVEIIGCWLLANKLEIPAARLSTAYYVFHFGVIAIFISILSITYDAVIIANERMNIYAIISIIDAFLRLGAVFIISVSGFDKLRLYALLLIIIPLFTLVFQLIYCRRFSECKLQKDIDKSKLKDVLSLSSWNFLGNMSFSLVHEGVNMLLNVFGGLLYNTSRTIAYQVKGVASQLNYNTLVSVRPKVMQESALGNNEVTFSNINSVSRLAIFTIFIPICVFCPYTEQLLDIWLVDTPESAVLFSRLIMISIAIRSLHEPLNMMYMAFGKLKRMMLVEVGVMLSSLILIYVSLKMGAEIWVPFLEMGIMEALIIIGLLLNAYTELNFSLKFYSKEVLVPFIISAASVVIITSLMRMLFAADSIITTLFFSVLTGLIYCIVISFLLNNKERNLIIKLIRKIIQK